MDLAFLNSLTRFGAMPPADPWMSGLTINYYYWGYLLAAALAKLSRGPDVRGLQPRDRDLRRLLLHGGGLPGAAPLRRPAGRGQSGPGSARSSPGT